MIPLRFFLVFFAFSVGLSATLPAAPVDDAKKHAAADQFAEDTKETKFFSLLPTDAKPPLDLNKDIMDKHRADMRKFYLNKPAEFR